MPQKTSRAWIPPSLNGNGAREPSPLGAARVRRRLTVDEVGTRAELDVDDVTASAAIAERLARELGVRTAALPGGKNPRRLVVIVGAKPG